MILIPDLLNKTLNTFKCNGINTDKDEFGDYIEFKQEFIGKSYSIPIFILHKNSPDLIYKKFLFGFGISDPISVNENKEI